jgi:hypothetical protein
MDMSKEDRKGEIEITKKGGNITDVLKLKLYTHLTKNTCGVISS